ncbi:MAG: rhombotarget lipoprotein [Desulfuromonadales bacterium]|jgi:rhombotail lipoprotein
MNAFRFLLVCLCCMVVALGLVSCTELFSKRKQHYASSVVNYLYPDEEVVETPTIPQLSLPLTVGIAFVPETGGLSSTSRLSAKDRQDLMERIAAAFRSLEFVKEIEIIPTAYLTEGGGFTNLDQIKTMYGLDVIALLSYDQVQHTDEGLLSLSYWTLVGAYLVKGEKNDTSTMLDAAVYDIASRKLLFRAPGTDHIKSSATPINLTEQLREDSLQGFYSAADNLIVNLNSELDRFKQKVKEKPQQYVVQHKPGHKGGSAFNAIQALMMISLAGWILWRESKN